MTAFVLSVGLLLAGLAPAADSLNVRLVGGCDTPGMACDVAVGGSYAFIADQNSGLRVISIADPAHPTEVGSCSLYARALAVNGSYAYVAGGDLRVISVADPAHPTEVYTCQEPLVVNGVAAAGSYVYVADDDYGLWIYSLSDPAHPIAVGHCDLPDWAIGVGLAGDYAYIADHDSGLRAVSVADPVHPVEVGACVSHGRAGRVCVCGDYAFVTNSDSGLQIMSIADPAHPVEVGYYRLPSPPSAVTVAGGYAYVGDNASGLRVLSVQDPADPTEVGYYTSGYARGLVVDGGYIYVTCGETGLGVFQFFGGGVEETPSAKVRVADPMPTVVRGVLVMPEAIRPEPQASGWLLDAAGRKVAVLHPGANDVSRLAPGVYFLREAHAQAQAQAVRKVVVAR